MLNTDTCGRPGCHKDVANGMQCVHCEQWFHPNCTGLTSTQYQAINAGSTEYNCVSCLYGSLAIIPPSPRSTTDAQCGPEAQSDDNPHTTPTDASTEDSRILQARYAVLSTDIERLRSDSQVECRKLQAQIDDLKQKYSSSNVAVRAENLSNTTVREAAAQLSDRIIRQKRVIFWGTFLKGMEAVTLGRQLVAIPAQTDAFQTAQWLRGKRNRAVKGLLVSLKTAHSSQECIAQKKAIQLAFPHIWNVTADRPLPDRTRKPKLQDRVPKDEKLSQVAIVQLTPLSKSSWTRTTPAPQSDTADIVTMADTDSSADEDFQSLNGSDDDNTSVILGDKEDKFSAPATLHCLRPRKQSILGSFLSPIQPQNHEKRQHSSKPQELRAALSRNFRKKKPPANPPWTNPTLSKQVKHPRCEAGMQSQTRARQSPLIVCDTPITQKRKPNKLPRSPPMKTGLQKKPNRGSQHTRRRTLQCFPENPKSGPNPIRVPYLLPPTLPMNFQLQPMQLHFPFHQPNTNHWSYQPRPMFAPTFPLPTQAHCL